MTALQSLCRLRLTGCNSHSSLADVDLSQLTRLTFMALTNLPGSFGLPARVGSLKELQLIRVTARPDHIPVRQMRNLSSLVNLSIEDSEVRREEVDMLQQLPRLQHLHLADLSRDVLNSFPEYLTGLCQALDRLTRLTFLFLEDIWCVIVSCKCPQYTLIV